MVALSELAIEPSSRLSFLQSFLPFLYSLFTPIAHRYESRRDASCAISRAIVLYLPRGLGQSCRSLYFLLLLTLWAVTLEV